MNIDLTLSQTSPVVFTCLQFKSFENIEGKGEIARNEQFLLFPQCFLPVWRTFCHLQQNWNCCLQTLSVWKSLKFVVWERVKKGKDKLYLLLKFIHNQKFYDSRRYCWKHSWEWDKMLLSALSSISDNSHSKSFKSVPSTLIHQSSVILIQLVC